MTDTLGTRIPFLVHRTDRSGPTVIEVAVAVTIAALLATIAIKPYLSYRARTFDLYVESAVRNAAAAQQAQFADGGDYLSGDCADLPGFVTPRGVICVTVADARGFTVTAAHAQATKRCSWTSWPEPGHPNLECA